MKEPSNRERADWANTALEAFAEQVGEEDMLDEEKELVISDLLSDLMHLCDVEEIDFGVCTERAEMHYREERSEERRRAKACLDQGTTDEDQ